MMKPFLAAMALCLVALAANATEASFAELAKRAEAGERLNVVFFGASLTWGANASDPQLTSFRGQMARRLEEQYRRARWKFWDAAIGGTGSQLGVFRFERDVLSRKPDLVFLDFSANDDINSADPETLASYESLVRRIVVDAKAPCVMLLFPFKWNAEGGRLEGMKRRDAHLAIAKAYNCPVGDAIALAQKRLASREVSADPLWPFDGVHPGDAGYTLFTDAAWEAFKHGISEKTVCAAPEEMLHAPTYMQNARVRISSLGELPQGWRVTVPNPTAAFFDMLMSRWLDDEAVASNQKDVWQGGKKASVPQDVARLRFKFHGSMLMFFGESTPKSCKYRVHIDGKAIEHQPDKNKPPVQEFDAGRLGRMVGGNAHLSQVIATGLDASAEHTCEIEPVFSEGSAQELRLESICVAGGKAKVSKY